MSTNEVNKIVLRVYSVSSIWYSLNLSSTFCFLCLSCSLSGTSSGSCSWGLHISSVTGMKTLRRLPMSVWAGDKFTPSNRVLLYERRALYGSSAFSSISFRVVTGLSDWPLDSGYPGLDLISSKHHGPLSDIRTDGTPYQANWDLKTVVTAVLFIELRRVSSGHLE